MKARSAGLERGYSVGRWRGLWSAGIGRCFARSRHSGVGKPLSAFSPAIVPVTMKSTDLGHPPLERLAGNLGARRVYVQPSAGCTLAAPFKAPNSTSKPAKVGLVVP